MIKATVVYLTNKQGDVCLARKKKAIHHDTGEISYSLGMYNGYGGKLEQSDQGILHCAIRELKDESGVGASVGDLKYCGEVCFYVNDGQIDKLFMEVSFYTLNNYKNEPIETIEMGAPKWFNINSFPQDMMPADESLMKRIFIDKLRIDGNIYLKGKNQKPVIEFINNVTI